MDELLGGKSARQLSCISRITGMLVYPDSTLHLFMSNNSRRTFIQVWFWYIRLRTDDACSLFTGSGKHWKGTGAGRGTREQGRILQLLFSTLRSLLSSNLRSQAFKCPDLLLLINQSNAWDLLCYEEFSCGQLHRWSSVCKSEKWGRSHRGINKCEWEAVKMGYETSGELED